MAEHSRRRAQPAKGRNVVQRVNEQRSDHHLRMNPRSAQIGALALCQGRHQLGEVQSLVNLDQQVLGSMKSRNCLVVNWNRVESRRGRSRGSIISALGNNGQFVPDCPGMVVQLLNEPNIVPTFSTPPTLDNDKGGR